MEMSHVDDMKEMIRREVQSIGALKGRICIFQGNTVELAKMIRNNKHRENRQCLQYGF